MIDELDPHQDPGGTQPPASAPHRLGSGWDRRTDDCGRPRRRRPRRASASRYTSRGCTIVLFSVPDATIVVRSTRCLVSSSTTPNCSTGRDPNVGSRYCGSIARCPQLNALAWRVRQRSAAEFERGQDLRRLRGPDACHRGEIAARRPRQAVHAAPRAEQLVGDRKRPRRGIRCRAPGRPVRCRRAPRRRDAAAFRAGDRLATALSSC